MIIKGNVNLPPFLMSSIPKSGTHLLHQILTGMPGISMNIRNMEKKFFLTSVNPRLKEYQDHFQRLNKLSNNEFGLGHVKFTRTYANMLQRLNLKHVFLYRDPRDVLVSMAYFIVNDWKDHPLHEHFNHLNSPLKIVS